MSSAAGPALRWIFVFAGPAVLHVGAASTLDPPVVIVPEHGSVVRVRSGDGAAIRELAVGTDRLERLKHRSACDETLGRFLASAVRKRGEGCAVLPLQSEVSVRLRSVIDLLSDEVSNDRPSRDGAVDGLLAVLAVETMRAAGFGREVGGGHGRIGKLSDWREVVRYLERHADEELCLSDLAERYDVSAGYLSRVFRERTGFAFTEYVNRTRILKACGLLRRGDRTVVEIAYECGFGNVSFFNRMFRRFVGTTPKAYRREGDRLISERRVCDRTEINDRNQEDAPHDGQLENGE